MAKVLVFQHVPYEPLGTLDALLRAQKHRVRYVNFGRHPDAQPDVASYDALIVLGGPMNIGQEVSYPHLNTEKECIRQAIEQEMPVLGICLGAQLLAAAFGARVYPAPEREIGWYPMKQTNLGKQDSIIGEFEALTDVFQWHGHTFELPKEGELLLSGEGCRNQAFRIGNNVYGFQFHLEANRALIRRWLNLPQHQQELGLDRATHRIEQIWRETTEKIESSLQLSERVFGAFLAKIPQVNRQRILSHREFQ
ncbi:type 1 glutamine amidotransferase [Pleionea sediminis]|uniref:type 1 glutamine amidotransferase n=1 Tax=Pleionea sediminis TaxID=2569479 RepID=UPI0013DE146D|nr:gamma-glutamyl-gamma-aminobutyrate hydrolase family protein [Pleionea sediminis]